MLTGYRIQALHTEAGLFLENILYPNSRYRRVGWFLKGRPNIRRYMRSVYRGFSNKSDLRFFETLILPTN